MAEIQTGEQTVLLHLEDFEDIEELEDSDAGVLLKAIVQYMRDRSICQRLTGDNRIMFRYIRRHIDRDKTNYQEVCRKRAEAGRRGGYAKSSKAKQSVANLANASKAKQSVANLADYDNDSESEYENEYEYESVSDNDSEAHAADAAASVPSAEERERRIRFLRTMMNLGKSGALEIDDLERYQEELKRLTGGG